jgi:hypothetical protein
MIKSMLLIITLLFLAGCEPTKSTYIKTERGLISFDHGYCVLGMLVNNDRDNILDEQSKPITCSGYIKLTPAEHAEYVK